MNTARTLSRVAIAGALALLAACSSNSLRNSEAANARARLTQLQNDPQLATMAPVALKEAEEAVALAEIHTDDTLAARHRVVLAERRVEIARAHAQRRYDEDQLKVLSQQRDTARLESRTREADMARTEAAIARSDAAIAREDAADAERKAALARSDVEAAREAVEFARLDAVAARQETAEVERQLQELNAAKTERGLVVTLGDVMFASGGSTLRGGTPADLERLATFLKEHPERNVQIEGHTDARGSNDSNLVLSQRRAEAVSTYLERAGVPASRLMTAGKGEDVPVASNDTVTGRQQNRRVEVIISNPEVR